MHITFVQDLIDIIRGKKCRAKNKIIEIFKNNNIDIPKEYKDKINLNIEGQNNTIIVPKNNHIIGNISINIYGDNNKIIFNENVYVANSLSILIGQNHPNFGKVINSSFTIGKNSGVESLSYITFNSNTYCNIEKDCMLSYGITIYNTDAHPIFKKDTKEVINKVITSLFIQGLALVIPVFWSKTITEVTDANYKVGYYLIIITLLLSLFYYLWSYLNQKTWYTLYNKIYI